MALSEYPPLLHYRSALVESVNVSYIESGRPQDPALILFPAFPSSANEYRKLMPLLAQDYHVISPSYPAFGLTTAPPDFTYNWSSVASVMSGLLLALNITSYAAYMHGYGADVGLRLALENPSATKAIISQNGNAYVQGFSQDFWAPIFALWNSSDSSSARATVSDTVLTLNATQAIYIDGTNPNDLDLLDSYQWSLDYLQNIQGETNQERQLDLYYDYRNNVAMYPQFQAYFRKTQVPLFALWAANDPAFLPAGAEAFKTDLPNARVQFLDAGHMAVESKLIEIATQVLGFLKGVGYGQ
jgi:pimeloyl-ACP methyl ester carboxylesterase